MARKQLLPSPGDLHTALPAQPYHLHFVKSVREQIEDILSGKDPRYLLIVGPCSIHDITAAKEYATKLKKLSDDVSETFLVVMRTYFEKPRTKLGWKGLLHDPYINGGHDIAQGLHLARQLLLDLAEMKVSAATEFLDPASPEYYGDLIVWGCIGARTSSSQIHRQIASGLTMPVAFKNSTDGNIDTAINGVQSASLSHSYIGLDISGRVALIHSHGNPYSHVVLRGGEKSPNYDPESIEYALSQLQASGSSRRILIDCSHDNCRKKAEKQVEVFQDVVRQIQEGNRDIKGLMMESHLFQGSQSLNPDHQLVYGVSLTDPCIDWEMTEALVHWGAAQLAQTKEMVSPRGNL